MEWEPTELLETLDGTLAHSDILRHPGLCLGALTHSFPLKDIGILIVPVRGKWYTEKLRNRCVVTELAKGREVAPGYLTEGLCYAMYLI